MGKSMDKVFFFFFGKSMDKVILSNFIELINTYYNYTNLVILHYTPNPRLMHQLNSYWTTAIHP